MQYEFLITERTYRRIIVEADTPNEAQRRLDNWEDEFFVLDCYDDTIDEISCEGPFLIGYG